VRDSADVIVIGLGAMGAAAACELSRRGASVIGIDRHEPPHGLGSTHGRSRIIRDAYFEHPLYVPLVLRARELWTELEELTGTMLYRRTGGLMVGPPDGALVTGALASASTHALEHEYLDGDDVQRRFPGLRAEPGHAAVFEPNAGVLNPEACVRTLLSIAAGYGATLHTATPVGGWRVDDESGDVVVATARGTLRGRHVVLAAGPWLTQLLASGSAPLGLPLTVERQVSYWFAPSPGVQAFDPAVCPIAIWEYASGRFTYTFPDFGHGVKIGVHHEGDHADPDTVDRIVSMAEEERARALLEWCMPGAAHTLRDANVCLYTNTPDGHFIIDRHPAHEQVLLVSACSGHGFKFASAIGEIAADVLLEGGSHFDLEMFGVSRFG
jgi:sarcosine oxidase